MFLCDECHNPKDHFTPFKSLGRCEVCGKTAECIDCHFRTCEPPKKKN